MHETEGITGENFEQKINSKKEKPKIATHRFATKLNRAFKADISKNTAAEYLYIKLRHSSAFWFKKNMMGLLVLKSNNLKIAAVHI